MTTFVGGNAATAAQPQAMAPHPVGPAPGPMAVNYQHAVIVQQTHPNQSSRYNAKRGRATGWVQLTCSILCLALGIAQLVVGSSVSIVGYGIWSGILFFLPTGILGVVSHNKNTCVIVSYMVMSIISSLVALSVLGLGFTSVLISASESCSYLGVADCGYGIQKVRIALDALITVVGFVELITAIVAASFCCAGVCCVTQPNTVVMQYANNPAPMVVMSPPGYTQQQMVPPYGQPAAYIPQQFPQAGMTQPTYPQTAASAPPPVAPPGGYAETLPPQYTPSPGFPDNTYNTKS
ncbi:uncharacterized protein [Diadema antillarum]|uniref:uncharacterized protein n=1 Tax=Diadema antillarum TaxID=105358 RepID=UPI003A852437